MAPWDATEDRALLLSVISVAQVNPNWEDVATQLGKTKEAVRYDHSDHSYITSTHIQSSQRFAKLKKEAGDPSAAAVTTNTGTASPAAAATPTPRKRKPKAKKAASDDEDEDEGTPLIKKSKQSKKVVKNENEDEDEA
jgi:hypothetical protein